jgi:hypothetical protein
LATPGVVGQNVTLGEQRRQQQAHLLVLADDDPPDSAITSRPGRSPVASGWWSASSFAAGAPLR